MLNNPKAADLPREQWHSWDPMLLSGDFRVFFPLHIFYSMAESSSSAIEKFSLLPHKLKSISINSMPFFPLSMSEGLFSAANIFSSLKLVYIFSVNPHLGPLQVSLSRMVTDIMKFFFLYVLGKCCYY